MCHWPTDKLTGECAARDATASKDQRNSEHSCGKKSLSIIAMICNLRLQQLAPASVGQLATFPRRPWCCHENKKSSQEVATEQLPPHWAATCHLPSDVNIWQQMRLIFWVNCHKNGGTRVAKSESPKMKCHQKNCCKENMFLTKTIVTTDNMEHLLSVLY